MEHQPGYLALYDAIVRWGICEITRDECIEIEDELVKAGWVIAPSWAVSDTRE